MLKIVAQLPLPGPEELAQEHALVAAEVPFARDAGGPLTRQFLDALPEDWRSAPLIVDSFLTELPPGSAPGPLQFHREPCPGAPNAARDLANRERGVEHIHVVFGPSLPEFLLEPISEYALPPVFDWSPAMLDARDAAIRSQIDAGRNFVDSPTESAVIQYDAATFLRWPPAEHGGLHFWIRATKGSRRPIANALRGALQV